MSLTTFSTFYYNFSFDADTRYINFDEGSGELTAEVELGVFAPTDMALNIQTAMNEVGTLAYIVTFNRVNRSFTIASVSGTFDLLINSGSSFASSAFPAFGFTGADQTGLGTYTGATSGSEYLPQFILQDHIATEHYQKLVMPSINTSATGRVEVIRFGTEKFLQCNIKYITNKVSDGKIIRYNPNGVEDSLSFLQYLMFKYPLEYMPDELNRSTFQKVLLESSVEDSKGTGFKLRELYDKGLPNYFETGIIKFRLIED